MIPFLNPIPITHDNLFIRGHLALNLTGSLPHVISKECWCKPFPGFYNYFKEIQGELKQPVWVHRNYDTANNPLVRIGLKP